MRWILVLFERCVTHVDVRLNHNLTRLVIVMILLIGYLPLRHASGHWCIKTFPIRAAAMNKKVTHHD